MMSYSALVCHHPQARVAHRNCACPLPFHTSPQPLPKLCSPVASPKTQGGQADKGQITAPRKGHVEQWTT